MIPRRFQGTVEYEYSKDQKQIFFCLLRPLYYLCLGLRVWGGLGLRGLGFTAHEALLPCDPLT